VSPLRFSPIQASSGGKTESPQWKEVMRLEWEMECWKLSLTHCFMQNTKL